MFYSPPSTPSVGGSPQPTTPPSPPATEDQHQEEFTSAHKLKLGQSRTPPVQQQDLSPPPVRRVVSEGHPSRPQRDFAQELREHLEKIKAKATPPPEFATAPSTPAGSPEKPEQQQQQQPPPQPEQAQQQPDQEQEKGQDQGQQQQQHVPRPEAGAIPKKRGRPPKQQQQQQQHHPEPEGHQQPQGPEARRSQRQRKKPDRFQP